VSSSVRSAVLTLAKRRLRGDPSARATRRSVRGIDAFALGEPWRRHVASAQSAQRGSRLWWRRSRRDRCGRGWWRSGLSVNKGVLECWEIAKRGDALDDTIRSLDPASIKSRLEMAKDGMARRSLESQMKSVDAGANGAQRGRRAAERPADPPR
jgi:hypothetical protein